MSVSAGMIILLDDRKVVVFLSIFVGLNPIALVLSALFALLLPHVLSIAPRRPRVTAMSSILPFSGLSFRA